MPGDRPTLFNPFLLSLGVLRWQRVGWLQWGGRDEGGREWEGRKDVGLKRGRVGGGGVGGAYTSKERWKQSPKAPVVSTSDWDFPLPGQDWGCFWFSGSGGLNTRLKAPSQHLGQGEPGWGRNGERDGLRGALGLQSVSQTWARACFTNIWHYVSYPLP